MDTLYIRIARLRQEQPNLYDGYNVFYAISIIIV